MPGRKMVSVIGTFVLMIIAGEWLMMQSHSNKEKTDLTEIAGKFSGLEANQGNSRLLK